MRVNLLKLDFDTNMVSESMAEVLPYEDNTCGHFCVACDEGYQVLLEATKNLPFKRTYNEAFRINDNGVPNYYYLRPETAPIVAEPKKRQRKKDGLLIGKDGCPICGKKRHFKESTCPNNDKKTAENLS